jgi:uncharacterized membrane protein
MIMDLRSAHRDQWDIAAIWCTIGLFALGLLNLAFGDTLLQWQPVARDMVWRVPFAYFSGILLLLCGVGLIASRWRRLAALTAAIFIAGWAIALHLPVAIAARGSVVTLLGLAENMAIALGLFCLAPLHECWWPWVLRGLGTCLIVFGLSHFVYADFTAAMVPPWLPFRLTLAYVTGAVHVGTGMLLLTGVAPRAVALVEAMMMTSFVLLLHVPRVLAAPHDRAELTMLAIATTLAGAIFAATRAPISNRR